MNRSLALSLSTAPLVVGGLVLLGPAALRAGSGDPEVGAAETKTETRAEAKAEAKAQKTIQTKADTDGSGKKIEKRVESNVIFFRGPADAGFLGVGLEDVEGAARGAKVRSVEKGSAAEKAGLAEGDVIVRFDGEAVRSAAQLARLVRETPAGRAVEIEVERDGAKRTLDAKLDERRAQWPMAGEGPFGPGQHLEGEVPELPPLPPGPPHEGPRVFRWRGEGDHDFAFRWAPERPRKLGIRYMEISGQLADYFKLASGQGILVTSVDEGGPAAKAGLKAGDLILSMDGTAIRDGEDLREKVGDTAGGTKVALKVQRDGRPLELEVTLAEPEPEGPPHQPAGVSL